MWFTSIKVETETKRDGSVELSRFFILRRFLWMPLKQPVIH